MKEIFEKIFDLALPYQNKRNDKGHIEILLSYVKKLMKVEKGNENIIIPAIILHDVGWSQMPREKRFIIFKKGATAEEILAVRYEHQEKGVKLAGEILNKVHYPIDSVRDILEIISEHDTRKGFISKEDGLVRDADKLWCFSSVGFKADVTRSNITPEARYGQLNSKIEHADYFYSKTAKKMAREELESRKKETIKD